MGSGVVLPTVMDGAIAGSANAQFSAGHGMHVSGLMVAARDGAGGIGACPGCGLALIRAVTAEATPGNPNGTPVTVLISALDAIISSAPSVINLSLALTLDPTTRSEDKHAVTRTLGGSVQVALDYDMIVVASIGNKNLQAINTLEAFPATIPGVISVGASDKFGERWNEMTIDARSTFFRTAGISTTDITSRCESVFAPGGKDECGSNSSPTLPAIYAPGAQILSTLDRAYIGTGGCTVNGLDCPPIASGGVNGNQYHVAPARNKYGNNGSSGVASLTSPAYDEYGTMTGTSMAAPIVSGTAGLVRSANPLISSSDILSLFQLTGTTLINPTSATNLVNKKIVNSGDSVARAHGIVRGTQKLARLIPMFSVCSRLNVTTTGCVAEAANRKWIFTTSPQVAQLAINSILFAISDNPQDIGIPGTAAIPYYPAASVQIGKQLTYKVGTVDTLWYQFPKAVPVGQPAGSREASASFYILSGPVVGEPVKPLWHLTSNCTSAARKHRYSVLEESVLDTIVGFDDGCTQTNLSTKQSRYVREGYVYANSGPGREAIHISTTNGLADQVVALASERLLPAYAGYTFNATPDGYVVPAVKYSGSLPALDDTDGDGLVDGLETFIGTNPLTAQSDCETGTTTDDLDEYPMASVQASGDDPMASSAGNCADTQLKMEYEAITPTPGSYAGKLAVLVKNPLGPYTAGATTVNLSFIQPGLPSGAIPAGCVVTSPPTLLSIMDMTCTSTSSIIVGGEFKWEFNMMFTPPAGIASGQITSTATDPVAGNNTAAY